MAARDPGSDRSAQAILRWRADIYAAGECNGAGYDSFQFTVNDGVADSLVPSTLTIDVTAVNDLPTATDNTVTATEDTAFVFATADFGFADVETDQLQSITVTTLASTGTLALNGSTVTWVNRSAQTILPLAR